MLRVSIAIKSERDRRSKFDQKKKVTLGSIKEVKADVDDDIRAQSDKASSHGKSELLAVTSLINKMRAEVAELRTEVQSNKDSISRDTRGRYRFQYGCQSCKAKDIARSCSHCFKCGNDDLKANHCKQKINACDKCKRTIL